MDRIWIGLIQIRTSLEYRVGACSYPSRVSFHEIVQVDGVQTVHMYTHYTDCTLQQSQLEIHLL